MEAPGQCRPSVRPGRRTAEPAGPYPRHKNTYNTLQEELWLLEPDMKFAIWTHLVQRNPIPRCLPRTRPTCPDPRDSQARAVASTQRWVSRSPSVPAPNDRPHSHCPARGCLSTGLWAAQGQGVCVLHLLASSAQHKSNSAHGQRR